MSLEIYSHDFSTRYEVSNAISILLSAYYDDVGKLTIVVPIDDYNIKALQSDCIAYDTDRHKVYTIQSVKTDTDLNRITARGFTAEWLLDNRCLPGTVTVKNVEADAYKAINDNLRGLSIIRTAPPKGLPNTATDLVMEEGQLLTRVSEALHESGLGRKAVWDDDAKQVIFEVYNGTDRTEGIHAVSFSDEQGSARDLVINDDMSTLKNVAYVFVEYKNDKMETISVGDATGDDRRELWSRRRVTQSTEETPIETRNRAMSEGALELAKNIRRQNFSVSIDPEELGKEYDIGDIVSCVSVRFGVSFKARVSGVKYTSDIRGQKTEVILGDPELTSIGGLRIDRA